MSGFHLVMFPGTWYKLALVVSYHEALDLAWGEKKEMGLEALPGINSSINQSINQSINLIL